MDKWQERPSLALEGALSMRSPWRGRAAGSVQQGQSSGWTDRQTGGGAEQGSLHVGVAPVSQRLVSLFDDLG